MTPLRCICHFHRNDPFFEMRRGKVPIGHFDRFGRGFYAQPYGSHRLHDRLGLPFHNCKRVQTGAAAVAHIQKQLSSPWWEPNGPLLKWSKAPWGAA